MSRCPLAALTLLSLALPSTALGADLTALAGPPVAADGDAESLVHVLCSVCWDGGKATAKSPEADVLSATMRDGLLTLLLRPQARATPGDLVVQVRGTGTQGKFSSAVSVPVTPIAGRIEVTTDAAWVEPGNPPVVLTLVPPPGPHDPTKAQYAVRASHGTLGDVTMLDNGNATVAWTPPETARAPQRVVFGVVDLARPDRRAGVSSLPVRVKTDLSFKVAPDSSNVLIIGEERVGPVQASPSGALAFSVALPPDEGQAVLETTTRQGAASTQTVDLPLGEGSSHLILPLPTQLPADGRARVPIVVAAVERDGSPVSSPPVLEASRGELSLATAGRFPGFFVAEWTAPPQTGTVEFTATRGETRDRWQSTLVEGLPIVGISAEPSTLAAGDTRYTLTTKIGSPPQGLAQSGLPRIEASSGRALGRAQSRGGSWVLPMQLPEEAVGATVQAVGAVPASNQPLADLLAWSSPPPLPSGGAFVAVAAVDAAGLPLPDLELHLSVPVGSGSLPPSVRTGRNGVALFRYDLGADEAPSVLSIGAKGHQLSLAILPGNLPAPGAGTPDRQALLARWQDAAPLLHVARETPAPVPVVAPAPLAAGPAAPPPPAAPAPGAEATVVPTHAGPEPSTAADAPTSAPSRAWARIGVDTSVFKWTLEQTAETGGVGPLSLLSEHGFSGTLGAQLRALLFPGNGSWGLDLQGGWLRLPQASASTTAASRQFNEIVGGVGVRYRETLRGPLGFHVLAQAERTPAFLHLYEGGDPAALDGFPYGIVGARLGGGLHFEGRRLYLETSVSETFAFAPVNLRATTALDVALQPGLLLRLTGGADWRSMAFEVAQEDVEVQDTLLHTSLGITIPLR